MNELAQQIETHLLDQGDWVPARQIRSMFNVTDRQLRQTADQQGLCSAFAISGDKGFKHVSQASTSEWLRFKLRIKRHSIKQLVRLRDLGRVRKDASRIFRGRHFEKDTGQAIMAGMEDGHAAST